MKDQIIKEILDEWVEKHKHNLNHVNGWDGKDFLDYSKQIMEKALQLQEEKILEIIDEWGGDCDCHPHTENSICQKPDINKLKQEIKGK